MGILKKVKNLVAGEENAAEEKPKKTRATKAAASDDAKPKRVTKKKEAPAAEKESAHEHDHAHDGHDHDHAGHAHTPAVKQERPEVVAAAVGVGATKHIVRALITEKGTLANQHHTYLFEVKLDANKSAIKQAIEKMYGVKVVKVRTLRQDGKVVRYGRTQGRRSNFKKAFVTVAAGQSITIHKGV